MATSVLLEELATSAAAAVFVVVAAAVESYSSLDHTLTVAVLFAAVASSAAFLTPSASPPVS